jgi:hypothetical protein
MLMPIASAATSLDRSIRGAARPTALRSCRRIGNGSPSTLVVTRARKIVQYIIVADGRGRRRIALKFTLDVRAACRAPSTCARSLSWLTIVFCAFIVRCQPTTSEIGKFLHLVSATTRTQATFSTLVNGRSNTTLFVRIIGPISAVAI